MYSFVEATRQKIIGLESFFILFPLECIPVVDIVVKFIKERDLSYKITHTTNQQLQLKLLQEKNRIKKISVLGRCVQAVAVIALTIFLGAGWYVPLAIGIFYGVLLSYNIGNISYNNHSIDKLKHGAAFVPRFH